MSETLKLTDNLLRIVVETVPSGATSTGRAVSHTPNNVLSGSGERETRHG